MSNCDVFLKYITAEVLAIEGILFLFLFLMNVPTSWVVKEASLLQI